MRNSKFEILRYAQNDIYFVTLSEAKGLVAGFLRFLLRFFADAQNDI